MTLYLVDKSAFEQQRHGSFADDTLRALATENSLATCEIVALELLCSARGVADYEQRWADLPVLPWLHVTKAVMTRALSTQRLLAARGQHRRPIPDLVIAAAAAEHDATVLHYDRDFDLIAAVTGQPPDGSFRPGPATASDDPVGGFTSRGELRLVTDALVIPGMTRQAFRRQRMRRYVETG